MTCWTRLTGVCAVVLLLCTAVSPSLAAAAPPQGRSASPASTHIRSPQAFLAHVQAGETVDVSFVKATDSASTPARDVTVVVRRPGGSPAGCQVPDTDPVGAACTLPDLTSSTSGIWQVEFAMSNCPAPGQQCSGDRFSWSITVRNESTEVPGRAWTEKYLMNQNATAQPVDLTFWYQSEFGYTYEGTYRQYNGIDSTIAADNFGVVHDGTCTPAYESSATLKPADGTCGGVFKVFFEEPAADLPAVATRWDSTTDWVKPPVANPTIANPKFTPTNPGSRAGTLTFELSDHSGTFVVRVDANADGDATDAVDRTLPGTATEGIVSVPFDGTDGIGRPIPANQTMSFTVVVDRVAEIHFTNSDVELRGGGVEVTRLNGPSVGTKSLYWNDTVFSHPDPNRCSETPVVDGRVGVDSSGGVHGWDLGSCGSVAGANSNNGVTGAWGDVRVIDDWTYVPMMVSQALDVPGHDVHITKTASTPTARPGEEVTYTITVENKGAFSHTADDPVVVTDDLYGVLDDATMSGPPAADRGTASFTSPTMSWSGALLPGEKATITYSVQVNQPTTGDRNLVNAVLSDTPGANCVRGTTDQACTTVVRVPMLKILKEADRQEYKPGETVRFTVTVTNDGEVPFTTMDPAGFTDDLTDVLDDGEFTVDDVTTTNGTVGYESSVLSWFGPLDVGQAATVTYVVKAKNPDTGNGAMRNVVKGSPGAAINCAVCEVVLDSRVVALSKSVASRTPNPDGSFTVVYDVTVTGGGSASSTYDLTDELRFGAGVTVNATSVVDLSGETFNVGWNGVGETSVATGIVIDPGETDVYRLTVTATPGSATTGTATDCEADDSEQGTGFRNTASITGSGGTATTEACTPIPRMTLTKTVEPGSPKPSGDGTYTVVYRIGVANTGATTMTYDLVDALRFGAGLSSGEASVENSEPGTVTANAGWDGQTTTSVASGVEIEPGVTHTYLATVVTSVDATATSAATDCVVAEGEAGTGFLSTATLSADGQSSRADACVQASNTHIGKKAVGEPAPAGDGAFTQIYDVTVTNAGAGAAVYDLADELVFGDGAEVHEADVVNTAPGEVPINPSWDGSADAEVASAVAIDGGAAHNYRVTVLVVPTPDATTGAAADCVVDPEERGTGFRNTATLTQNGRSSTADACTAPPAITVAKQVIDSVPNSDGTYTITYEVTVANDGAGAGRYDLADSLEFGADVEIVNATAGTPVARDGWNGADNPFVISNASIDGNASHTYVVTVTARPPDDPAPGELDCELDAGESGTGARNTATVLTNGMTDKTDACAAFPHLSISKTVLPGSPRPNDDNTLTVVYQVEVNNAGATATTYDLTDELLPGDGITLVSATVDVNPAWDGAGEVVSDVAIAARATHTYELTAVYTIDPTVAATAATDCTLDRGETGTGFLGRAVAVSNGVAREAQACAEAALLTVTQELAPVHPNGDGTYTAVYDITVENDGAGAAVYSMTAHLLFGSGIRAEKVVANAIDGSSGPDAAWPAADEGHFVTDVTIPGGSAHRYRITATVRSAATGSAADCVVDENESGTGLRNLVTMTSNGVTQEAVACEGLPAVAVSKDVTYTAARGDGKYDVGYRVTVVNNGAAAAPYDLHDTLRFGPGATIESATIDDSSKWDGRFNPLVAENAVLNSGEKHTYVVKVVATPPRNARAEALDCALGHDEEGTGGLNTAAVLVNGVSATANACVPFPGVTLTKVVLPGSPRVGPDGDIVIDYRITVINNGAAEAIYDLHDELQFGTGTEVTSATVRMSPDVAPINPSWNGRSDHRVASGVHLAAGTGHTFIVTVRADRDTKPEVNGCDNGGGLRNAATVAVNGVTMTTDACAPMPADGLAATGLDLRWIAGLGAALLLAGIVLVLLTRRRRV